MCTLVEKKIGTRQLGKNGPVVSEIGLGCMGMSEFYGSVSEEQNFNTLQAALDMGCNFFDTANIYGLGENERLLGRFFANKDRESFFLATKCGAKRDPNDLTKRIIDNSSKHIKQSCQGSLERLKINYIDLYYIHRIEGQGEKIKESMRAMADLLQEGKIHYVGLSEPSKEIIREANATLLEYTGGQHQLTAVQTEYSLMSRTPEIDGAIATCLELNIGFVPYAPLGRQFLTASNLSSEDYPAGDVRKFLPRFQLENAEHNQKIVANISKMAKEKGCTSAQLSLAWVLAQDKFFVPIPGTKRIQYLKENLQATSISLSPADLTRLDKIAPIGAFRGTRYTRDLMRANNLKTEEEVMRDRQSD